MLSILRVSCYYYTENNSDMIRDEKSEEWKEAGSKHLESSQWSRKVKDFDPPLKGADAHRYTHVSLCPCVLEGTTPTLSVLWWTSSLVQVQVPSSELTKVSKRLLHVPPLPGFREFFNLSTKTNSRWNIAILGLETLRWIYFLKLFFFSLSFFFFLWNF